MGIVHHSRYLPYLEEARVEYLRHLGHPYTELRAEGVDYAVLEAFVQYRQPLRFDDQVMVHLRLGAATRATFQMAYLLTVDEQVRATAVTVHGCVNEAGSAGADAGLAARPRRELTMSTVLSICSANCNLVATGCSLGFPPWAPIPMRSAR